MKIIKYSKALRKKLAAQAVRSEDQSPKFKIKSEQFKKQLEKARIFTNRHYKNGLQYYKLRVLWEIAENHGIWEAITNTFNIGYLQGYQAAQRNARKRAKAAAKKPK